MTRTYSLCLNFLCLAVITSLTDTHAHKHGHFSLTHTHTHTLCTSVGHIVTEESSYGALLFSKASQYSIHLFIMTLPPSFHLSSLSLSLSLLPPTILHLCLSP